MTSQPPIPACPESPPETAGLSLPCDPDAERALAGAVLLDENAFDRAALKSTVFKVHRYRWLWEAYEKIRAADYHIDFQTLRDELVKAGHYEELTAQHPLEYYLETTTLQVEGNARRLREMDERCRMIESGARLIKRGADLSIPLPAAPEPVKGFWSQEEMAAAEFPAPDGPVPGLFPNGLTILGGRPKRGKSWLMLQLGCALGLGGKFLDHDLHLGKVLYYALEDQPRRLKDRTAKLGIAPHALIYYQLSIKPLHLGGMASIEQAARGGGYQMIIIDTIRRALPGKDFNKDGALFDDILSQLQVLAQQNHIAIVCVLHTRKSSAGFDPDPVDDMLGSTGLTASADCVLALYTEQGKKGAVLKGRGRDLDDIDLALEFDPVTCAWQSLGETGAARNTQAENEILEVLEDLGKAQSRTIARTLGKDYSNTHKRICTLWTAGKIKKEIIEGSTVYFLPQAREDGEVPTMPTTTT